MLLSFSKNVNNAIFIDCPEPALAGSHPLREDITYITPPPMGSNHTHVTGCDKWKVDPGWLPAIHALSYGGRVHVHKAG